MLFLVYGMKFLSVTVFKVLYEKKHKFSFICMNDKEIFPIMKDACHEDSFYRLNSTTSPDFSSASTEKSDIQWLDQEKKELMALLPYVTKVLTNHCRNAGMSDITRYIIQVTNSNNFNSY